MDILPYYNMIFSVFLYPAKRSVSHPLMRLWIISLVETLEITQPKIDLNLWNHKIKSERNLKGDI